MFKKKVSVIEEPTVTQVVEASETGSKPHHGTTPPPPPPPPKPEPKPVEPEGEELDPHARKVLEVFQNVYAGVVLNGQDHVRAGLAFATYGEVYALVESQDETNRLLRQLIETIKEVSK